MWIAISLFFGLMVCELIVRLMWEILGINRKDDKAAPWWLTGALMGMVERLFFTIAVALSGPGAVITAMIVWITLKGQTHYNVFSATISVLDRRAAYTALIASLVSMIVAMLCGSEIYNLIHQTVKI